MGRPTKKQQEERERAIADDVRQLEPMLRDEPVIVDGHGIPRYGPLRLEWERLCRENHAELRLIRDCGEVHFTRRREALEAITCALDALGALHDELGYDRQVINEARHHVWLALGMLRRAYPVGGMGSAAARAADEIVDGGGPRYREWKDAEIALFDLLQFNDERALGQADPMRGPDAFRKRRERRREDVESARHDADSPLQRKVKAEAQQLAEQARQQVAQTGVAYATILRENAEAFTDEARALGLDAVVHATLDEHLTDGLQSGVMTGSLLRFEVKLRG